MSFLSAAFLWGLPLLSVPVAIHLLSRRQQDVVKWGAMQFLLDSRIRRRKMWRLDDLLLMLLRTLAVICIILALARPLWHGTGLGRATGRDVIFVWDVSGSMARELDDRQNSFDRLLSKTSELMDQLGTGDTVRGMITIGRGIWLGSDPLPASSAEKQRLLDELKKVGVTQSSADWDACLNTALRTRPPQAAKARLIVAVSDGQAYGWQQQDEASLKNLSRLIESSTLPVSIELHNAIGTIPAAHNLAVDKLTTPRQLLGVDETFIAEAEIRNHGQNSVQLVSFKWLLDDDSIGKSSVGPFAPGQSRQITIKQSALKPGIRRLKCRLELHDNLDGDNERILILETIDKVPLLLVDDSTENDPLKSDKGYLLAAVGQDPSGTNPSTGSSVFRVTTVTPKEFATQSLSDFRAVVFANAPDVDDDTVSRLTDFVRAGGGLWMALGDKIQPNVFNDKFYRSGGGLCPWPIESAVGDLIRREDFATIHPPEKGHPATVLLGDTQRLDVDKVKVFRHFAFATAPAIAQVPVLLQTGTGDPLAIEGFLGRGRVFIQTMPMGVRWSNFPLTQAYVPMVHEWLWYLIQPTAISRNLLPGEPLQIPLPQNEHVREVRLKRPNAPPALLPIHKRGEQSIARSRETFAPGQYEAIVQIEGKADAIQTYQVSRPAEESDLSQWPQELTTAWTNTPGLRLDPLSPLALPSGTAKARPGEPIWSTLLGLVVLAILGELWLARRIAGKRFGTSSESRATAPFVDRSFGQILGARGNR